MVAQSKLAVADSKLGGLIKAELPNIQCIHDTAVDELMRGIRFQLDSLLSGLSPADAKAMRLGALLKSVLSLLPWFPEPCLVPCRSLAQPLAVQAQDEPGQSGHHDHPGHL